MPPARSSRARASIALLVACLLWAASFPFNKALSLAGTSGAAPPSTWFVSAYLVAARFLVAAALLGLIRWSPPTRREAAQGFWLGVVTGAGMLLQTDALAHTLASTVAFLTQGYVVFLPLVGMVTARKLPSARIAFCAAVVLAGLAVLSRFDPRAMTLGRGEGETLAAAVCFTAQILILDAASFSGNRQSTVTLVMFATIAMVMFAGVIPTARGADDFFVLFHGASSVAAFVFVVIFPTLGSFLLMNLFQRGLEPSEAGIIYATEPVFASGLALFLPAILSRTLHVDYADETIDARLSCGGALVVAANVLMALSMPAAPKSDGCPPVGRG